MQRYHPVRQSLSLLGIMTVSAFALYFFCNTVNYFTVYRMQNLGHHPFKGQVCVLVCVHVCVRACVAGWGALLVCYVVTSTCS